MPKNDALSVDLNLLAVFHLLMQERSVTRVANRISLGQPAVSRSLARLREELDDPLFVRQGNQLEPTPRAVALDQEIKPALDLIERALRSTARFDPQSEERVFRIAMSDDAQVSFLPAISEQLLQVMPKCRLVAQQSDYLRAGQMLSENTATIVVGYLDKLPAEARIRKICRVGYRAVMCKKAQPPKTLNAYMKRDHVLVTFAGDLTGYIDEALTEAEGAREVLLSVPSFAVLPYLLQNSNRVATVPSYVADELARQNALRSENLPFRSPKFDLSMAWRAATDRDPAEVLLRKIIVDVVRRIIRQRA
ncbi:MAG: LysR family transcriptional regulator [Pseudomonadota bacterium]